MPYIYDKINKTNNEMVSLIVPPSVNPYVTIRRAG